MDRYKREIFGRNEYAEAMEIKRERREWKEKILDEATDLYKKARIEGDEKKIAWYQAECVNILFFNQDYVNKYD